MAPVCLSQFDGIVVFLTDLQEVLRGQGYSESCDWWSAGVIAVRVLVRIAELF